MEPKRGIHYPTAETSAKSKKGVVESGVPLTTRLTEDMETHWRVALKVLPEDSRDDPGTLARFRLESQAGMKLKHPAITYVPFLTTWLPNLFQQ